MSQFGAILFVHFWRTLFPFFGKIIILMKNGAWGSLYHLMHSNFIQNIKKIQWANFEQYTKKLICLTAPSTFAPVCPFWGQIGIFPEKSQHHLKRLMVFYLYAKKYKKTVERCQLKLISINYVLPYMDAYLIQNKLCLFNWYKC